ncbi:MAG: flagellin [Methanoregula sp.]|nr:MAG: flagellin [Methanoregula sp.]
MLRNLDDDGFTGLEAAIVLIAFVVVAAVFSYVVLGAGFFTTQKAQETVYKGVEQSTTNILLKGSVYGIASAPSTGIDTINMTLGLAPGAPSIDLTKMKIVYSNATIAPTILSYSGTGTVVNSTFYSSQSTMTSDDQVYIMFTIVPAPKNTDMNIEIRPPGGGAAIPFTKTVPATITAVNVLR